MGTATAAYIAYRADRADAVKVFAAEVDDFVDLYGKIDNGNFSQTWRTLLEDFVKHEGVTEEEVRSWKRPKLSKDGTRVIV